MAIVHWDPSRELSLLQGDVNRVFERFFTPATDTQPQRWVPPIDITEEGEHFVLRADLPGMSQHDVIIEVQDQTLTIAGERSYRPKPEHDGGFARLERAHGKFQRTITLPEGIDAEAISASFADGVLELQIPKPVETQPRRIPIGAGASKRDRSVKERVLNK